MEDKCLYCNNSNFTEIENTDKVITHKCDYCGSVYSYEKSWLNKK